MGERAGSLTATSASRLLPIPSAHSVGTSTGALPLVCPPSALHSALVLPSPRTDTLCARASVTGGAFLVVQLAVHLQGQTPPPARAPSIEPLPPQAGCTPIRSDCALTVCLSLHCALWARPVVLRVVFNGRESLLSRPPPRAPRSGSDSKTATPSAPFVRRRSPSTESFPFTAEDGQRWTRGENTPPALPHVPDSLSPCASSSLPLSLSPSLALSLSLSLSISLTHTHTHSLTHARTHSLTRSLTLCSPL